jgi:integrase
VRKRKDPTQAPRQELRLEPAHLIRPDERLKQAIEAFLLDQRSEHTRRAYGKDLKRFVQYLLMRKFQAQNDGKLEPAAIDRSLIIGYKEFLLSEKLEHTTVDRHLATLRSFFGWLEQDGLIEKNPAEGVRFLNPRRLSKTNGLSDDEVQRLLALPDLHSRVGALHYAILMVLFYCGLRRSELCSLLNSSVGKERGHHVIRLRGKGNSERVIPLLPAVWNAIRWYRRISFREDIVADEPLFTPVRNNRTGELGKALDPSSIFYIVAKYARLAGVAQKISPHSCRATAISNARDRNVPDRAIQEFAGWSTPDMITRYDKRKTAVEKSAALAIDYGSAGDRAPLVPADIQAGPEEGDGCLTSEDLSQSESLSPGL